MGFVLTIIYIALAFLSPAAFVPSLAEYRIQLLFALFGALFSIPAFLAGRIRGVPQIYIIAGLAVCIGTSMIANQWAGGAILALNSFLPSAIAFYLILANCRSWPRVKTVTTVMVAIAIYLAIGGAVMYFRGDATSPMIIVHGVSGEDLLLRIRGYGFLNDPNDLGQYFVVVLPFIWALWRSGKIIRNFFLVAAPTAVLLLGIYLTHSRGTVLALMLVVLFSLKDRLGVAASSVVAGIFVVLAVGIGFTGGRAISASEGAERMEAWGAGLQFLKSHPLFGIGYGQFQDQFFITAHNSFVLSSAELGIIGYFFWIALLVFTFSQLNRLVKSSSAARNGREPNHDGTGGEHPQVVVPSPSSDAVQTFVWAKAVRTSLVGFVAAAWFLSRAYTMTLFVLVGLTGALVQMAPKEVSDDAPQPSVPRRIAWTLAVEVASIVVVWVMLRVRGF